MIAAISAGSSSDGVPPPKKIVSARRRRRRCAANLAQQRRDVLLLQRRVEQAAIEVAVVADRGAERDVDVEAEHKWSEHSELQNHNAPTVLRMTSTPFTETLAARAPARPFQVGRAVAFARFQLGPGLPGRFLTAGLRGRDSSARPATSPASARCPRASDAGRPRAYPVRRSRPSRTSP